MYQGEWRDAGERYARFLCPRYILGTAVVLRPELADLIGRRLF